MDHFVGLDVSVKETSICIVDETGKIVREVKVASEPDALLQVLAKPAYRLKGPSNNAVIARDCEPARIAGDFRSDLTVTPLRCVRLASRSEARQTVAIFMRRPSVRVSRGDGCCRRGSASRSLLAL